MGGPYKVFHSACEPLRKRIHLVLIRPEQSGNVGATARALANMGIWGSLSIVGSPAILTEEAERFSKHAKERLQQIQFCSDLRNALSKIPSPSLSLAATARIG